MIQPHVSSSSRAAGALMLLFAASCTDSQSAMDSSAADTDPASETPETPETSETSDTDGPEAPEPDVNRSSEPFDPDRTVSPEELRTFWRAQLEVALATYEASPHATEVSENFAFSPASVGIAMAMASAGANGASLDEIAKVLQFPAQAQLHDLMATSIGVLQALEHPADDNPEHGVEEQSLSLANSLWPQAGLEFSEPFLDELSVSYDVGVYPVDYVSDPEGSREMINAWVSHLTREKIPELIPPGVITEDTRLTIVNAMYLKAPWRTPFNTNSIDRPFYVPVDDGPSQAKEVPTMTGIVSVRHAYHDDGVRAFEVIELPFGHDDLAFTVVRARCADGATCPEHQNGQLSGTDLVSALDLELAHASAELFLPKFDIRANTSLKEIYEDLGMSSPFEDEGLEAIAPGRRFMISDIIHESTVAIDEKGAEAAAATAVIAEEDSEPWADVQIVVDEPFWFVIRSNEGGIPLFIGHVADPA